MKGGRLGFFQGDIRNLSEDFRTLKPTVIPCVPRILNRMYDKVFIISQEFIFLIKTIVYSLKSLTFYYYLCI